MTSATRSDEQGFSLIELTIALVVTLIVTGAIFGLLAGGQSAFRREPELSDRQQNIRVAMDLIMRDISNAGAGLPEWTQVFTQTLDGPVSTQWGLNGAKADELEMITNSQGRDNEPLCANNVGFANNSNNYVRTVRSFVGATPAITNQSVAVIFFDGTWTLRYVTGAANAASIVAGEANCTSGSPTQLTFASGDAAGMNNTSSTANVCQPNQGAATGTPAMGTANSGTTGCNGTAGVCCTAAEIAFVQLVRYRIRDNAGVPELQRWDSSNAGAGWQTVARSIEDMQVQYTQANGTVTTAAQPVVRGNYATLTTQVQVTLSSRSEAVNIEGATADANRGTFVRGSLTWTGSPRSALVSVAKQGGVAALWR